ncbi:hypothetical protein [Roseiconus lacunae]|uniref:hypothetical protein n=1 Tax=Roseiconus lacunae TaxID=2605694 RepID=UPI001E5CA8EC|nr:hypothetical protein [Roseiconus lacunae]MCD0457885.1 hypothetical protein [Roseiconus lacunae]
MHDEDSSPQAKKVAQCIEDCITKLINHFDQTLLSLPADKCDTVNAFRRDILGDIVGGTQPGLIYHMTDEEEILDLTESLIRDLNRVRNQIDDDEDEELYHPVSSTNPNVKTSEPADDGGDEEVVVIVCNSSKKSNSQNTPVPISPSASVYDISGIDIYGGPLEGNNQPVEQQRSETANDEDDDLYDNVPDNPTLNGMPSKTSIDGEPAKLQFPTNPDHHMAATGIYTNEGQHDGTMDGARHAKVTTKSLGELGEFDMLADPNQKFFDPAILAREDGAKSK